jgi:hypothetical protein
MCDVAHTHRSDTTPDGDHVIVLEVGEHVSAICHITHFPRLSKTLPFCEAISAMQILLINATRQESETCHLENHPPGSSLNLTPSRINTMMGPNTKAKWVRVALESDVYKIIASTNKRHTMRSLPRMCIYGHQRRGLVRVPQRHRNTAIIGSQATRA